MSKNQTNENGSIMDSSSESAQRLEAIKNLIFGENIVQIDQDFQSLKNLIDKRKEELENLIDDTRKQLNTTIDNLSTDLNIRITDLENHFNEMITLLQINYPGGETDLSPGIPTTGSGL